MDNNSDINNYDNFSSTGPTTSFNEMGANNQNLKSIVPQPTTLSEQKNLTPVEIINEIPQIEKSENVEIQMIQQEIPQLINETIKEDETIQNDKEKNNTMVVEEPEKKTEQDMIKSNIWFTIAIFVFIMIFIILLPYINNWVNIK